MDCNGGKIYDVVFECIMFFFGGGKGGGGEVGGKYVVGFRGICVGFYIV